MEFDTPEIVHNPAKSRFEIRLDGQLASLDYSETGDTIILTHVGVPDEFQGRGLAAHITRAGLDYAKARSLRVVPMCSYVAAYIRRHPEYADLTRAR